MPAAQEREHAWRLQKQIDSKSTTKRRRAPPTPLILSISNVVPQHCSIKKIEKRRREPRKEIGSPLASLRSPMQDRGRTRSPRIITSVIASSPGEMFIHYEPKHYQIKKCPPPRVPEGAAAPPLERRDSTNSSDSITVNLVRTTSFHRKPTSPGSRYSGSTVDGSDGDSSSMGLSTSSIPSSTMSSIGSSDAVVLFGGEKTSFVQLPSLPAPCAGPSTHRIQVQQKPGAVWRHI